MLQNVAKRTIPTDLMKNLNDLSYNQILYIFDTLSRSGASDWNLWDHLCERIKPELKSLNVYDNLKIVHSLAKVPYRKLSLLSIIDRLVLKRFSLIDSRHLTQYLIDLNKLDNLEVNTFTTLIKSSDVKLFSSFDLCFLLHLTSKLQLQDTNILDRVSEELLNNVDKFQQLSLDRISVAVVIRSLGFLQYNNELFKTILNEILPSFIYKFGSQELTNTLLAIIIAHLKENFSNNVEAIITILLDRIADLLPKLTYIEVNQLFISLYYLKYNFKCFNEKHQGLLDSIIKLNLKFTPNSSKLQMKLSNLLDELKLKYQTEHAIGPYKIDYVVDSLKLAIEVNGYSHFYHQTIELNGITQLKYKILEDLGWIVIGINYYNWKNRNKQERLECLLQELKNKSLI